MQTKVCIHTKTVHFWIVIAALFVIAKTWKPSCPSVGEQLKKLVHDPHGILVSNKKEQTWSTQSGWISRELWVKKAKTERLHAVWFHLHKILEMCNFYKWRTDSWLPGVKEAVMVGGQGAWHEGTWKDGNALHLECINVNILILTPHYNFTRFYHWGKLGKVYVEQLSIFLKTAQKNTIISK